MKTDREKLEELHQAIGNLDGVSIPWNVIKNCLAPLDKWLDEELAKEA